MEAGPAFTLRLVGLYHCCQSIGKLLVWSCKRTVVTNDRAFDLLFEQDAGDVVQQLKYLKLSPWTSWVSVIHRGFHWINEFPFNR
ncbi:MAG: hypothetical protein JNJ65_01375 [Cyclobacteriaceae bacterium]|nr:hypothetical protein [Cyclobacteriaceae bacterium]